jgi:hypothetical protein
MNLIGWDAKSMRAELRGRLDAVFLGVMAERAVAHLQKL